MAKRFVLRACIVLVALGVTMSASAASNPPIRVLTEQEVVDLMTGTAILGTRSSDTDAMIARAKALLAGGKQFRMISIEDLPDDWNVIQAAGGIGGGDPWQYVVDRVKKQNLPTIKDPNLVGMEALSRSLHKKFDALIENEAAGATLNVFMTAAEAGLPVVDACPAGRAKPEVEESIPFISGYSVAPAAFVSRWGDVMVVDKVADDYRYEDIGRAIAVGSGGGISNARGVYTGKVLKQVTIHGFLSEAMLLGKTVREAKAAGKDPVAALMATAKATELFRGTVTKAVKSGDRGFTWWDVDIAGEGKYAGHTYRVWVKNENMVTWLDGKPDVTAPDNIWNIDPDTGRAMSSPGLGAYTVGAKVVMLGRAPHPAWRTAKGIDTIGPRHFGFDFDYRPMEVVLQQRAMK